MTHVLITGVTGFAGAHLARYILNNHPDVEIFGMKRWRSSTEALKDIEDRITLLDGDLTDRDSLDPVVAEADPDVVFHLGAQSFVPYSFTAPTATLEANTVGTDKLLRAISCAWGHPKVVMVTSSEVYGQVEPDEIPIKETQPFRPVSPYGVSKAAQDHLGFMYYKAYKMPIIRLRPFTYTGPGQHPGLVTSAFARQIALIEKGRQEPVLHVGNVESVRTFCDVRDMVQAFWLAGEKCEPGEAYNIGGEATMSIADTIGELLGVAGRLGMPVKVDSGLLRPADVTLQIPCVEKFQAATGWRPALSFGQTLSDVLEYWRARV